MKRFGNQSKKIAGWLRKLADLDANTPGRRDETTAEQIFALRRLIPTSILQHYDHFKSRGKRSVAPITRGVCGSCHLALPSGVLANLRRMGETLHVCINCGAFVYLTEEELAKNRPSGAAESSKKTRSKGANARLSSRRPGNVRHAG